LLPGRFANVVLWKTVASSSFCRQGVFFMPCWPLPWLLQFFSPVFHAKQLPCIS
jgi:hypothetical protein